MGKMGHPSVTSLSPPQGLALCSRPARSPPHHQWTASWEPSLDGLTPVLQSGGSEDPGSSLNSVTSYPVNLDKSVKGFGPPLPWL